jgi:Carboxypeptidase regulatory-like domain
MLINGRTMWSREEINSLQKHAVTRWSTVYRFIALVSAMALFVTGSAYAQGGRATINGTVTDPSGAVIGGAHISAKNLETGQITTLTTGSEGNYSLPFVPIGRYEITASHPGFTTETHTNITLSADQTASVNFALKTGEVTTSVEVKAEAVELETTSGAISQVVDQKSIVELPLDGRNPAELVYVAPGAVNGVTSANSIATPGSGSGFPNAGQETAASVNGSRMGGV